MSFMYEKEKRTHIIEQQHYNDNVMDEKGS